MKAPTFDELVLLPEPLALQRHFDARNYKTFRWLLVVALLFSLGGIGGSAGAGHALGIAVYTVNALVCIGLFVLRDREFFARSFRQVLLTFLFVEIVGLKVTTAYMQGDGEHVPFILVAFLLLLFRFRLAEHFMLFATFGGTGVFPLAWLGVPVPAGVEPDTGGTVAVAVISAICLALSVAFTQIERRRFLSGWRREHVRYRERLRMREEIEYARKIQLSMLPQGGPEVDWLDLAAASLPATEVGGDYYEYFKLSDSQLVLVIGDVAGHGLASGLLLSGVRSCLYLLEEYLAAPVEILERLNHMVRRTTDKRTYMTLLFAVLERGENCLTVVSAGHPPVLHYDTQAGVFHEVGLGAPPLGTFLDARYEPVQQTVSAGDLLVFYTDGMVEARNGNDQEYGDDRLRKAVARAANSRTVRDIRDAVLGDLSNFKGDQEQADDMTLVVMRLR